MRDKRPDKTEPGFSSNLREFPIYFTDPNSLQTERKEDTKGGDSD